MFCHILYKLHLIILRVFLKLFNSFFIISSSLYYSFYFFCRNYPQHPRRRNWHPIIWKEFGSYVWCGRLVFCVLWLVQPLFLSFLCWLLCRRSCFLPHRMFLPWICPRQCFCWFPLKVHSHQQVPPFYRLQLHEEVGLLLKSVS